MRLDDITPVILTYNEEPNIGRVLAVLAWAKDIVVVDSASTDRTREIAGGFRNVRIFVHAFESHAAQWRYATGETAIATGWILVLDSDYILSERFARELELSSPPRTSRAMRRGSATAFSGAGCRARSILRASSCVGASTPD